MRKQAGREKEEEGHWRGGVMKRQEGMVKSGREAADH